LSLIRRRGQIKASAHILDWLESIVVWLVLLYRRVRYGYAFRRIHMAQPKYAKVDPADYKRLRGYEWLAKKGRSSFYARRRAAGSKAGKEALIYLHQEVIEVPEGMVVDHINHDGMDNRRANLRAATYSQNLCHRKKRSGAKQSKYKGIYWRKKNRKWQAVITFDRKKIYLGYFRNEIDAAKAYDRAAMKYHGEFASLNFPESGGAEGGENSGCRIANVELG
jgi:hypothetical protein